MHLAKSHKAEWNPRKTRIELLCKSQQADIATPCSYCGSTSKEPKSHVVACPVIFQSIFIDLLQNGSSNGGELLSAPAAGGKPEPSSAGRSNDRGGRHGSSQQETSDGRSRQGLGKRQAQAKAAQGTGALRAAFSAGSSRHPETDGGHRQTGSSTGGCEPTGATGLRLHLVCEPGGGQRTASHVRSQRGVETHQGSNSGPDQSAPLLNHETKSLVTMENPPLTTNALLQELLQDVRTTDGLRRFHASRPLTQDQEVCFSIQVALRGEAGQRIYQNLNKLCGNMVLKLLKSRLRPDRSQRNGMAKMVEALLYG